MGLPYRGFESKASRINRDCRQSPETRTTMKTGNRILGLIQASRGQQTDIPSMLTD